jgi:hypothetical protein
MKDNEFRRGRFVRFDNRIHLVHPTEMDRSLCGVVQEAHETEDEPELKWLPTRSKTVTCDACGAVVLGCRGVRVARYEDAPPVDDETTEDDEVTVS